VNQPENAIAFKEGTIDIAADPAAVYALVSDLPSMGSWSPESFGGSWMNEGSGEVGDWFEGHNRSGEREWTRESQVAVADPGAEFTFVVGGVEANCTWWSYELAPSELGTTLTEKWWIVNKTPALQGMTEEQFHGRVNFTQSSIDATLAAIKATAEGA